ARRSSDEPVGIEIFLSRLLYVRCPGRNYLVGFWSNAHTRFRQFADHVYVYENPSITRGLTSDGVIGAFVHSHARNWHPLTTISHMLDCQLYGLKAGGHHFTNVLLHSVAVVLLFFVLRQMTGGPS